MIVFHVYTCGESMDNMFLWVSVCVSECVCMCMYVWTCSCVCLYVLCYVSMHMGVDVFLCLLFMYAHVSICVGEQGLFAEGKERPVWGGAQRARPTV